jgi:uncharacterized membrane protein
MGSKKENLSMKNENTNERETRTVYVSCCAPVAGSGGSFWGVLLLVIGLIWLLSSLTLVASAGKFILPAIFITLGVAALWNAKVARVKSRGSY